MVAQLDVEPVVQMDVIAHALQVAVTLVNLDVQIVV